MRSATGAGAWLGPTVAVVMQAAGPLRPTAVVIAVSEDLIFDGSLVREDRGTYLAEAPADQA